MFRYTMLEEMTIPDLRTYIRASRACGDVDDALRAQDVLNARLSELSPTEHVIVSTVQSAFEAARDKLDEYPELVMNTIIRSASTTLASATS